MLDWGEKVAMLVDEDGSMAAHLADLKARGDLTAGPQRQQARIDVVVAAMKRDPELAKRLVSDLEGNGVVEAEGEGWALAKQGISESGEDGPADGETHSWRPLLGWTLGSSRGLSKGWYEESS